MDVAILLGVIAAVVVLAIVGIVWFYSDIEKHE